MKIELVNKFLTATYVNYDVYGMPGYSYKEYKDITFKDNYNMATFNKASYKIMGYNFKSARKYNLIIYEKALGSNENIYLIIIKDNIINVYPLSNLYKNAIYCNQYILIYSKKENYIFVRYDYSNKKRVFSGYNYYNENNTHTETNTIYISRLKTYFTCPEDIYNLFKKSKYDELMYRIKYNKHAYNYIYNNNYIYKVKTTYLCKKLLHYKCSNFKIAMLFI